MDRASTKRRQSFACQSVASLAFACVLPLLAGSPAFAGKAAGDACAAKLDADGQTIYAAALPSVGPSTDLRAVLTDLTRSLVMSGKVSRGTAKASAEAAGQCLQLGRS